MKKLSRLELHSFDFFILLFFSLSFIGWLWEVCIYLFIAGRFVNRGMYYGPYLPIYGVGGILLYLLFHRLRKRPVVTFLSSMALCCAIEYFASWFMELRWGVRWWDYSDEICNINGRICLISALAFGLSGVALNCIFMPVYIKVYHKIQFKYRMIVSIIFLIIFLIDATFCTFYPHTGRNIAGIVFL